MTLLGTYKKVMWSESEGTCGRERDPSTGQGVKVLMLQEKESAMYSAGHGEPVKNFK